MFGEDSQRKKTAKLIIATKFGIKKPEDKGGDEGQLSAAEDLIKAVHEKDPQGVVDALQAYQDVSSGSEEEEEQQEEKTA